MRVCVPQELLMRVVARVRPGELRVPLKPRFLIVFGVVVLFENEA